jgi:glucose-1-phosphate adenylyltransferase
MPHPPRQHLNQVASIILAGGQGTRLYPLTHTRCKPSVCFGGRYRLIDIPISNSLNARVERIFVISQYFAASLQQHILETYQLDEFQHTQIQMLCPEETPERKIWFKGTADAIRQNKPYLEASSADYFLVLSGDQLYNIDFVEMLEFSKAQKADLVIASLPVQEKEAHRMGLLKINEKNQIVDFVEKPTDPSILKRYELSASFLQGHSLDDPAKTHYLGSMGIYIFKREALLDLVNQEGDDFGKDLIPLCVKNGNASAYVYKGYWEDIGTIRAYYNANMALLSQKHCLNTYDIRNPIFTHPHNLPSPLIKESHIHNSIVSQGCIIEAKEVSGSIVGVNIKVDQHTLVRNSILLGSLFYESFPTHRYTVGKYCHLENTILDESSSVGNHVTLTNKDKLQTFDGDGVFIRDGIIIVTSGTRVPDGFIL